MLDDAYCFLGFDQIADDAFRQLVLARIVKPTSKAGSIEVLDGLGVEHASLRAMFKSLARCVDRDYRSVDAKACFDYCVETRGLALLLYDVTTLFFKAENEDGLRKVGFSKERRVDPQIVVGLLVDRAGFPLEIHCFDGNKAETQTFIAVVKAFQERHEIADMVCRSRRGDAFRTKPGRPGRGGPAVHCWLPNG